jgi:sugar phosphate isomerase/epimerase
MNRRVFLTAPAAAGALRLSAKPAMLHLGAVTYNILHDYDLERLIGLLEQTGFEGVELRTTHRHGVEPSLGAAERTRVRHRFERSKVRLVCLGTTCEFHSVDTAERQRQVQIGREFADLARDTGAKGIKVRPNAFPAGVSRESTIRNIADSLRDLAHYSARQGVEVYLEIHGEDTGYPAVAAAIMKAASHPNAFVCWNSDMTDVENGSIRRNFELVRRWIRHVHINELANDYPWRELFALLRESGYSGFTMCEADESKDPERFLRWYRKLWTEFNRTCG